MSFRKANRRECRYYWFHLVQVRTAEGQDFHTQCFSCQRCGIQLGGKVWKSTFLSWIDLFSLFLGRRGGGAMLPLERQTFLQVFCFVCFKSLRCNLWPLSIEHWTFNCILENKSCFLSRTCNIAVVQKERTKIIRIWFSMIHYDPDMIHYDPIWSAIRFRYVNCFKHLSNRNITWSVRIQHGIQVHYQDIY